MNLFITIRILDIIDIFLVAFLLYQLYMLIRGTIAINIFAGIVILYVIWLIVKALNMELLGSILGQIIGVGVLALLIVFQQEVRKFLLFIGSRYMNQRRLKIESFFFPNEKHSKSPVKIDAIVKACRNMAENKTGALIVIGRKTDLQVYADTGDIIKADTSARLLESIFFKNSPMHDGAAIIIDDKIYAVRCVLPVTDKLNVPAHYGLRHKAALGITEISDCIAIAVSEETGSISVSMTGKLSYDIGWMGLSDTLKNNLK